MRRKTAQAIAEMTSEVLGYGVLVTDEDGVIIGCSEVARVGKLHAPSLPVLASGMPNLTSKEEAQTMGVKPGYTAPIMLSGRVAGTVSIAGLPRDVERYGRLVKRQAEVLLMEQAFLERRLRRQWAVQELAESIMLYRPEDGGGEALLQRGQDLGFDLGGCRIAVVLNVRSPEDRPSAGGENAFREMVLNRIVNFFGGPEHLVSPLSSQQIVAFLSLSCGRGMEETALHLCEGLVAQLREAGVEAEAGIGRGAEGLPRLAESAHLAREALSTGRALGLTVCAARDLSAEMLLSYLPAWRKRQHIEHVLGDGMDATLTETFLAWCRNPFSANRVARELSIHRNTLQYRLKKIREVLGLDPWNFHDGFAVWSALILRKFSRSFRAEGAGAPRSPERGIIVGGSESHY